MKTEEYNERFIKGFKTLRREMERSLLASNEKGIKKAVDYERETEL